jgi:hypothetical protein
MAAIAGLAEEVVRLALHFKLTVAIADAAEAERAAQALRAAAGSATEGVEPQSRREAESGGEMKTHDAQLSRMVEAATTGTSQQRDGWIVDTRQSEMDVMNELYAARGDLAKVEAAPGEPKDTSCRAENAIAACVLKLQDRLGGFIRP